jgi:hypothetical protein
MDALLPDPGELLRVFLLGQPAVTAIVGDRISVALSSGEPSIRYRLVTGSDGMPEEDHPQLQVEAWGRSGEPDDGIASLLLRTVRATLPDFRGQFGDAWVANAYVTVAPYRADDPETGRPRLIVQIRMLTYALEASP